MSRFARVYKDNLIKDSHNREGERKTDLSILTPWAVPGVGYMFDNKSHKSF